MLRHGLGQPMLLRVGLGRRCVSREALFVSLVLVVVTVAVFWPVKGFELTGWLWYMISLASVTGIIPVGNHCMADRHTYVPLMGVFVITAGG